MEIIHLLLLHLDVVTGTRGLNLGSVLGLL
jgi:hypothetical protein